MTIKACYSIHFAAILGNHADMPTHLSINDPDPITVMLSNNAFSEQQQNDQSEHFSFFLRIFYSGPFIDRQCRSFAIVETTPKHF
jgi:hypothetical protein